jgi:hypothetical protein
MRWAHAGVALVGFAAGMWAISTIRSSRYYALSPLMPTTEKAIVGFSSADGLRFVPNERPVLLRGAASQTHLRRADGTVRIVATDPTVLNDRLQPDSPTPPRCSTLFEVAAPGAERAQLFFPPCVNRYGDRTSEPLQCVDPTILPLPQGRARLIFVRIAGREDPAFTLRPNQFFSAVTGPEGGWTFEPGVRFSAVGAADPDVVALPAGGYRMYFTKGDARGPEGKRMVPGVFSARSDDGLVFREEPGTRVHFCSASATVALDGGGFRMYCHLRDLFRDGPDADPSAYVLSYFSSDGLEFREEAGIRVGRTPLKGSRAIGAGAPSVARDADGGWQMLITTVMEPRFPWNHWVFHSNERHFTRVVKATTDRVAFEGQPPPMNPSTIETTR